MSCCDSPNKSSGTKRDLGIDEMIENNNTKNKSGKGKFLLTLLHLTMLAILIFGDDVEIIESNLNYIIIGYVLLFLSIVLLKSRQRIE
jgi:hypothetical protein